MENSEVERPAGPTASQISTLYHLWVQKVQFAVGVTSPLGCGGIFFFGKDVYILTFAADVKLMGAVSTTLAIVGPLLQPIIGYCMDRLSMDRYFPKQTWGRRAPWFATHSLVLALATAAVFMPPSFDKYVLCWWYLFWTLLATWLLGVIFNAWESARLEIYTTKEERAEVEAIVKFTAGVGTGFGVGVPLIVAAGAPFYMLALATAACFFFALISLISVPVLRQGRIVTETAVGSFVAEMTGGLRVPVIRHLILYRCMEGYMNTLATTTGLYYLTFVDGLTGRDRSLFTVLAGAAVGIAVVLGLPFWVSFFRVRRKINVNVVCAGVMALGCAAPLFLLLQPVLPRGIAFSIWCLWLQGSLSGQTFWRAVALGWVADEDCHNGGGKRREALIVGLINFFASGGRAAAVGTVLLGLGACGMELANCDTECEDAASADDCLAQCDARNVSSQPQAVRTFMNVLTLGIISVCQVICALLVYSFPIYGARLDTIYDKQAELSIPAVVPTEPDAKTSEREEVEEDAALETSTAEMVAAKLEG